MKSLKSTTIAQWSEHLIVEGKFADMPWLGQTQDLITGSYGAPLGTNYNRSAPCVYNVIVWGDMSHAHRVAFKSSCTKKAVIGTLATNIMIYKHYDLRRSAKAN